MKKNTMYNCMDLKVTDFVGIDVGPPIQFGEPITNDNVTAGYGYKSNAFEETDRYFYHPDHLGSTSIITDKNGVATQFVAYMPYGESFVDEHSSRREQPYKFNGKELDEEVGLYYYGARYYEPEVGKFYGIDPMTEKYPNVGGMVYCHSSPVIMVDPDGMGDYYSMDGSWMSSDGLKDDKTYIQNENGEKFLGPIGNFSEVNVSHKEFATMSNVVKHESSGNKTESLWVAHTANNAKDNNAIDYQRKNETLYDQLTDANYSTVPKAARTPLNTSDNSTSANNARAAILDVLTGGADPTGGAVLWDGRDFLTKGTNHNKFKEYKSISINSEILNSYSSNNSKYTPASIFTQSINKNSDFNATGSGKYYNLISTGTSGGSIFWKLGK
jgi:RHS repeat-associated protein